MSPEPDWTLLSRYFAGECSPEEAAAVDAWAAADGANARLLAFMRTVWDAAAVELPEIDEAAAWRTVRARMAMADGAAAARPLRVMPRGAAQVRRRWLGAVIAAGTAAALVAAVGVAWRRGGASGTAGARGPEHVKEYATARGERSEFTLVDGTRVWLSADSRLRVLSGYGAGKREVELVGEAYFVVRHDQQRPFRVYARGTVSEDLGTEFNVRSYPEDSDVVVVVASGRVSMRRAATAAHPASTVELGRGQMGRLDGTGRVTVTSGVDPAAPLAWREGRLEFDQRPLSEVLRELGRWYDLDVALEDSSLAGVPVTVTLDRHPADEALDIVSRVVGLRYTREGRIVRLAAKASRR
jgi:ferric-dicitrate binding protein FerR (iron transport regulator)